MIEEEFWIEMNLICLYGVLIQFEEGKRLLVENGLKKEECGLGTLIDIWKEKKGKGLLKEGDLDVLLRYKERSF